MTLLLGLVPIFLLVPVAVVTPPLFVVPISGVAPGPGSLLVLGVLRSLSGAIRLVTLGDPVFPLRGNTTTGGALSIMFK